MAEFKRPKLFTCFPKFPNEIQYRIWEILAQEPRVVTVKAQSGGLHSSIPPILHVCSVSRLIGLKYYTPSFERPRPYWHTDDVTDLLLPCIYFNFERDTLYFQRNWNETTLGSRCCIRYFASHMNGGDLQRLKRIGFDVSARVCPSSHTADFSFLPGLEVLYLGYESAPLGSDCAIDFTELESKYHGAFLRKYNMNPAWNIRSLSPDVETIAALKEEASTLSPHMRMNVIEPVRIKHL